MNSVKNAALVLQHQDGREHTRLDGFDKLLVFQFITRRTETQGVITLRLLRSEVNVLPLGNLENLSGLDRRTICRLIQPERQAGAWVCISNLNGYFWAENKAERAVICP